MKNMRSVIHIPNTSCTQKRRMVKMFMPTFTKTESLATNSIIVNIVRTVKALLAENAPRIVRAKTKMTNPITTNTPRTTFAGDMENSAFFMTFFAPCNFLFEVIFRVSCKVLGFLKAVQKYIKGVGERKGMKSYNVGITLKDHATLDQATNLQERLKKKPLDPAEVKIGVFIQLIPTLNIGSDYAFHLTDDIREDSAIMKDLSESFIRFSLMFQVTAPTDNELKEFVAKIKSLRIVKTVGAKEITREDD